MRQVSDNEFPLEDHDSIINTLKSINSIEIVRETPEEIHEIYNIKF